MILLPQLQVGDEIVGPPSSTGTPGTGLMGVTGPHTARSPTGDTGLPPPDEEAEPDDPASPVDELADELGSGVPYVGVVPEVDPEVASALPTAVP